MNLKSRLLGIGFVILATTTCALAQVTQQRAQTGFRFLANPVSAEVMGNGGVGVVSLLNSNALFWNPAGVAWIPKTVDANLNYISGIAGINYTASSVGIRIGNFGVLGLSGLIMDYGTFYGTRRANNDQGYVETGTFQPQAFSLALTFAQKVSDRFSYGVNLKYAYQDLGSAWIATAGTDISDPNLQIATKTYKRGVPALDVGAYYDFLSHGVRFGAVVQNISQEIKYEAEPFPLPFLVSFGLTVEPLSFLSEYAETGHSLVLSVSSQHPRDFSEKFNVGLQYKVYNIFTLRGGYMTGYDQRTFTAGAGVAESLAGIDIRFDYAYEPFGIFGAVNYISLGATY